jgi:hypothetical protein
MDPAREQFLLARPAGGRRGTGRGRPRTKALDWLKQFAMRRKRLLLYKRFEDWHAFGPPAFQAEMRERISRGEKPWT